MFLNLKAVPDPNRKDGLQPNEADVHVPRIRNSKAVLHARGFNPRRIQFAVT